MGLRGLGGSGPRRVDLRRAGVVALVVALYVGAGVASTWPALKHADDDFMAEGLHGLPGAAAPGDHLQAVWQLWLPGHQLGQGDVPWRDPYSFRPEAEPRVNFAGWPFSVVFWPPTPASAPSAAGTRFSCSGTSGRAPSPFSGCARSASASALRSSAGWRSRSRPTERCRPAPATCSAGSRCSCPSRSGPGSAGCTSSPPQRWRRSRCPARSIWRSERSRSLSSTHWCAGATAAGRGAPSQPPRRPECSSGGCRSAGRSARGARSPRSSSIRPTLRTSSRETRGMDSRRSSYSAG